MGGVREGRGRREEGRRERETVRVVGHKCTKRRKLRECLDRTITADREGSTHPPSSSEAVGHSSSQSGSEDAQPQGAEEEVGRAQGHSGTEVC